MKKRNIVIPVILCVAALLAACGKEKTEETSSLFEAVETEAPAQQDTVAQPAQEETEEVSAEVASEDRVDSAPVEYETADGFMGSFLLASDRDKIDTTNDYGVFYRVIYEASIEGDELKASGSMDYRNFKDQDPITISSDVTHVFKVDDNTVYQKEGEAGTETVSKEDFAGLLDSRKDSGMFFEVEISGGVVKTATLMAQ